MVNGRITVAKLNELLCGFYLRFTITITRGKRGALNLRSSIPRTQSLPKRLFPPGRASALPFLLGRRGRWHLDIDINLSRAAAKQSSSKDKRQSQKQDYENHQNCDDARTTAATVSIVSHKAIPPVCAGGISETNQRGMQRLLSHASDSVNRVRRVCRCQKNKETRTGSCLLYLVVGGFADSAR
jgi:hypothetical protein